MTATNIPMKPSTLFMVMYYTANAQELAGNELNGLWVGKYRTTGSCSDKNPTIKSGLNPANASSSSSLNNLECSKLFGPIDQSGHVGAANQHNFASPIDTRVAKNDDWGAISYFATSRFGNNTVEPVSSSSGQNNIASSTTGNKYGVHGLAGNVQEYTLSTYNNTSTIASKYYNNYSINLTSCTFVTCGGQATYETAVTATIAWNSDTITWPTTNSFFMTRSGSATNADGGVFFMGQDAGTTGRNFHVVANKAVLNNIYSYPNGDTYLQVYGTGIGLGSKIYVDGVECTNLVIRSTTKATCDTPALSTLNNTSLGDKAITIVPPNPPTANIQNFTETCTAPYGTIRVLTDTRDNQTYRVRCMEDAHWWMIDNLKLDPVKMTANSQTLTTSNTNLDGTEPADFASTWSTITAPVQATASHSNGKCTNDSTATLANGSGYLTCDGTAYTDDNDGLIAYSDPAAATNYSAWVCNNQIAINKDSLTNCGYLYNWYTATAGTGNYQKGYGTNATASICPAGWYMPYNTATNDFGVLNASMLAGAPASSSITGSAAVRPHWRYNGEFQGSPSGNYINSFANTGSYGYYWSARAYSDMVATNLSFFYADVSPGRDGSAGIKYGGYALRCIL
ncbi:hypothetical protein FACS189431_2200 [Alphaproteobacteria bacterium]|nr:hypothetical protein FACS189431_2200 [Alphaproteobacteria bacterium]